MDNRCRQRSEQGRQIMGTEKKEEEGKQKAEDKRNEEGFVGEELEEYEDPLPLQ